MKELREAEFWLESAKNLLEKDAADRERYTVAAAQAIHSIIRANDALTQKFLGKTATRHDEAAVLFSELVRTNKIPAKYSDLRKTILIPAVQTKSKVDYHGQGMSKTEAERWIMLAERFLEAVKNSISTDFARAKSVRSYKILSEFCR